MKYLEFRRRLNVNVFTILDVKKFFPEESETLLKIQLSRFRSRGLVIQMKRGLYCFDPGRIEELELAGKLYQPSYISLESALNYYGMIPDVPQAVESVSLTNTKNITNQFGTFHYMKIKQELFWGYQVRQNAQGEGSFLIADGQKALLDFFYIRKIKSIRGVRLDLSGFDFAAYRRYARFFPDWVQQIIIKQ